MNVPPVGDRPQNNPDEPDNRTQDTPVGEGSNDIEKPAPWKRFKFLEAGGSKLGLGNGGWAHGLLTILLTVKILILVLLDARYLTITEDSFRYIFSVNTANTFGSNNVLFSKSDVKTHLESTVAQYYDLQNISVSKVQYRSSNDGGECIDEAGENVLVALTYLNDNTVSERRLPLDNFTEYVSTMTFIDFPTRLQSIRFSFPVCSYRNLGSYTDCFEWDIGITYKYMSQVAVVVNIDSTLVSTCQDKESMTQRILKWFEIVTLLFAVPYMAQVISVRISPLTTTRPICY
jgi:hypothetical protein